MQGLLLLGLGAAGALANEIAFLQNITEFDAQSPFDDAFVSFSIEFSSFPDYAGNLTYPNVFSDNLLSNIGDLIGTKPYIRVGGNTQDYALYDPKQKQALIGIINATRSPDYPTTVTIGPSFFESYQTWPYTRYSHGFNMALANTSAGWQTLNDTVPLACKAIGKDGILVWEYGNEPDLYSTSAQGLVRPSNWNESTYVSQWLNGTRFIKSLIQQHCPDMTDSVHYGFMGPSFAGVGNHLKAPAAWKAGIDSDGDVRQYSTHNYISGATSPGVTLQGTLLNHTRTMQSVDAHIAEYNKTFPSQNGSVPLVFGETNSLYNQGKPGLSNSFGAALWGVDFNLYAASQGVRRVHMHQGTNYRYASWQPVETSNATRGTKPPYYGNIAVAAFLGNTIKRPINIAHIPLKNPSGYVDPEEAAYAAFDLQTGALARVIILNMHGYNTTLDGSGVGTALSIPNRISREYTINVGQNLTGGTFAVQRLMANGSDAITGITWDGWSFNYELNGGLPVHLSNVTVGERLTDLNDTIVITVPDSSAAVITIS